MLFFVLFFLFLGVSLVVCVLCCLIACCFFCALFSCAHTFLFLGKKMDLLADFEDLPVSNDLWQSGVDLRSSGVFFPVEISPELSTSSSDHESNNLSFGTSHDSDEYSPSSSHAAAAPDAEADDEDSEPALASTKKQRRRGSNGKDAASGAAPSRKRKTTLLDSDSITLSRDVLLTISSEEFDEHIANISSARKLSEAEHKEIRRQKRLIKNRESAALSRNRKKQALESLEAENAKLREELSLMKKFLQQTNQLGAFASTMASPLGAARGSAAGVLLVLVLSFGLFVNMAALRPVRAGGSSDLAPQPNLRQLFSLSPAFSFAHQEERNLRRKRERLEKNCNVTIAPMKMVSISSSS